MDFAKILQMLQAQSAQQNSDAKATSAQIWDKTKMELHPELAGPRQAEAASPEQERFTNNNMALVSGSLNSVAGAENAAAKMAEPTVKEIIAANVANHAVENGANMAKVAQKTQALGREADFAQRMRDQLAAMRKSKLGQ